MEQLRRDDDNAEYSVLQLTGLAEYGKRTKGAF